MTQPLRADAARNRQRLIAAAGEVFARRGLDVPMEELARHAGVGVGTLYRHFSSRADLIAGSFEAKMRAYADAVERGLTDPDPWSGFCGFVWQICEMQGTDRGFANVLTMTFPHAQQFEAEHRRAYQAAADLIRRARAAGKLRDDFVPQDLVILLMANAGVVAATADAAPDAWRRFVAHMLESFAAPGRATLPQPPSRRAMDRALTRLQPAAEQYPDGEEA
jgi:AcrR family transcriptional regulator